MRTRLLTVIVMAMWTGMLTAAEPASALLEKGIYAEETLGDVDGAIRIYQQIVQENTANRAPVAQAQYRLGRAYLKKKQHKEAAEAFEQVIGQFPDQKTLVAEAKKQLAETRTAMGESPAPAAAGPKLLKTHPAAFTDDVDPALDRITATFGQKMKDGSWSWTGGGETFPQLTGKISYDAAKTTCTLPVKLEPGKLYVIGINGGRFRNFQTAAGVPAKTHLLVFTTASADGKPTPIADEWVERVKATNGDPAGGQ